MLSGRLVGQGAAAGGAEITVVEGGWQTFHKATNPTFAPTDPAGVSSGDLLIFMVADKPDSVPTGWTDITFNSTPGLRFYARIADGGANDSVSVTRTGTNQTTACNIACFKNTGITSIGTHDSVIFGDITRTYCYIGAMGTQVCNEDCQMGFFLTVTVDGSTWPPVEFSLTNPTEIETNGSPPLNYGSYATMYSASATPSSIVAWGWVFEDGSDADITWSADVLTRSPAYNRFGRYCSVKRSFNK